MGRHSSAKGSRTPIISSLPTQAHSKQQQWTHHHARRRGVAARRTSSNRAIPRAARFRRRRLRSPRKRWTSWAVRQHQLVWGVREETRRRLLPSSALSCFRPPRPAPNRFGNRPLDPLHLLTLDGKVDDKCTRLLLLRSDPQLMCVMLVLLLLGLMNKAMRDPCAC
jgi:hypothetical protein